VLEPIEATLHLYIDTRKEHEARKGGNLPKWAPWLPAKFADQQKRLVEHYYQRDRTYIADTLLDAIDAMDSETFYEFAFAIDFLKDKQVADPLRYTLLTAKLALDKQGQTMAIRDVAQMVGEKNMNPADGFARLRRVCKELRFPISPSRPISRVAPVEVLRSASKSKKVRKDQKPTRVNSKS